MCLACLALLELVVKSQIFRVHLYRLRSRYWPILSCASMSPHLGPVQRQAHWLLLSFSALGAQPLPCLTGASLKALARSAANEAGWSELLRNAAWWLGENANLACNEYAGHLPPPEQENENEAPAASTTPLEMAALQASTLHCNLLHVHHVPTCNRPELCTKSCMIP